MCLNIVFEVLGKIIPLYEKKNVIICIENHYVDELGNCPEEFLYLFEKICSPSLRFCFDYGHANLTDNIFEFIEKLYPYFGLAHISDNDGKIDQHIYYGDGNINWKEVLTYTLKKGFLGPYIIEFGGKKENIEKIRKFELDLKNLYKEFFI
ncbi:MAG: TIM barrel protein [Candidatus Omnitrophota bacterium]|nr:TIM barrel protein [Candidatus Omnitrophota bacterium]